jgi:DNA repair exonuclease SbcCD ATPase subunit
VAVGALVTIFMYDKFIIPGKDAELSQKNETIRTVSEERDRANRENGQLTKQVDQLRIYRGQDAPPLKRKALILAQQIQDFTKDWRDTDSPEVQNETVFKYLTRFGLRAQIIRDDLDQNGQLSEALDNVMYNFGYNYKDVRKIAEEIEKLAKKLPEH